MNRPLQLCALLDSLFHFNQDKDIDRLVDIFIVYRCDSDRYLCPYHELISKYGSRSVYWINQGSSPLKIPLQSVPIHQYSYTTTLVDDILFRRTYNLNSIFTNLKSICSFFYLRLGREIQSSLMLDPSKVFQPSLKSLQSSLDIFNWRIPVFRKIQSDWYYLFTLDGMVCNSILWEFAIDTLNYSNPSQLEARLQTFSLLSPFIRSMCFESAALVNLPFNLIQAEYESNPVSGWSSEFLLELYSKGYSLDYAKLRTLEFSSPHHLCSPFDIYSIKRGS